MGTLKVGGDCWFNCAGTRENTVRMRIFPASGANLPLKLYGNARGFSIDELPRRIISFCKFFVE